VVVNSIERGLFVLRPNLSTNPPTTVFADDFETAQGWTTNAGGTDTATTGQWQRADPAGTSSGVTLQLGTTKSGVNDLVTGATAGASAGANDIDGGVTTVRSPAITLPSTGTLTLSLQWYLAHLNNASSADFFRVTVIGTTTTTMFQQLGAATNRAGAWATATADISSFAGQTVRIQIETADAATASLVEAGVDDLRITQQL
jgi:carboxypeptidase T